MALYTATPSVHSQMGRATVMLRQDTSFKLRIWTRHPHTTCALSSQEQK